ncbi:YwaF family protein [Nesterenkonia alkaliphila]|uniref:TIGR02206 family membrane protein n=1 Tax=Nesterenkonia alkaliphila TaxID=1463631 RepID=A0A7K1UJB0_9MICC|nr:TIGR02206 family membrane protein [Nesterenkonia alkaliphila]MVT26432.1 TIGR02206 family membrane protein [Nesterenkonia alkaliphila]GFZ95431.1 hypothetical protein GCM10011359_26200 [Nesterenkonia alkaliphila]
MLQLVEQGEAWRMPQYGLEHGAAAAVIAAVLVASVILVRRCEDVHAAERWLRRCGWVLLTVSVAWTLWGLLPMNFLLHESLPFHFSDAIRLLTAISLIARPGWAVAVLYYWGFTLNLQSVLTPDLNYRQVEHLEYLMYWLLHGAALIVPAVLVWGLGYRPTWRGYALTLAATGLWGGVAMVVNSRLGTTYSYVSGGPEGSSLLDVLGPWPLYLVSVAGLMVLGWGLMTWPWETPRQRENTARADRFGFTRRIQARSGGETPTTGPHRAPAQHSSGSAEPAA